MPADVAGLIFMTEMARLKKLLHDVRFAVQRHAVLD